MDVIIPDHPKLLVTTCKFYARSNSNDAERFHSTGGVGGIETYEGIIPQRKVRKME